MLTRFAQWLMARAHARRDAAVHAKPGFATDLFAPVRQALAERVARAKARAAEHKDRAAEHDAYSAAHMAERDAHLAAAEQSTILAANPDKLLNGRL